MQHGMYVKINIIILKCKCNGIKLLISRIFSPEHYLLGLLVAAIHMHKV